MSSSSSLDVDCLAAGLVSGLAARLVAGEEHDLLAPLRFLAPGSEPEGAAPEVDRRAVARGLAIANASYGHPRARELAQQLADPKTRVVATGQQSGLLGGPLLGYVKAAAAVRWAERLTARGEPAVAIFWMATEDHDWDEVATARFALADGVRELALGADPQPLTPVGMRTLGGGVRDVFAALDELFPSPWARAELGRLATWWRPDARFGEAFARQLVATFGARSPLVVDAQLPELKEAEVPYLARLVAARRELGERTAAREREIERRGLHLQVPAQPAASPLFLLRGGERRRIEWRGADRFALRGAGGGGHPVPELLATIEENPAVVSPGALARPAIQDAVFGTFLQVMGPAELGYLAQAAASYETLGLAAPWTSLRPSAMLLDRRDGERLAALGVSLAELLARPDDVERRLGERAGGDFVAPLAGEIAERLAAVEERTRAIDPTLERAHRKTTQSVERALGRFAAKVAGAAARADEASHDRFRRLLAACRPNGRPQERVMSAAQPLLRFGAGFGESLLDGIGLDPRRLSVVRPEREEGGSA